MWPEPEAGHIRYMLDYYNNNRLHIRYDVMPINETDPYYVYTKISDLSFENKENLFFVPSILFFFPPS